jgi:DNA-binding CsgD family transcriptional regulator
MGKSDLLRVQDVRDAYQLIGDCRDLGSDPARWHRRMFEGLRHLIGVPHANGGEVWWQRPHHPLRPVAVFESCGDQRFRDVLVAYRRANASAADPIFSALQYVRGQLVTRTRRHLVPDTKWYCSARYEYRLLTGCDHQLTSLYQVSSAGAVSVIGLHRAKGERDFSPRELRLLNFFHDELGRLIGRSLVSATEPSPDKLSPRLRQTLACLLEGDSEKQVAGRLELSQATTHQYVTALYRHFKVRSRAQLLAHIIKRMGRDGAWDRYRSGTGF